MKKNVWFTGMAAALFLGLLIACNQETDLNNRSSKLSLIAPSHEAIATDLNALEQQTAQIAKLHYGAELQSEITNISYEDVDQGFFAWVEYKLSNGYTSRYVITNNERIIKNTKVSSYTVNIDTSDISSLTKASSGETSNIKTDRLVLGTNKEKTKSTDEVLFYCEALPGCTHCKVNYTPITGEVFCTSDNCAINSCQLKAIIKK